MAKAKATENPVTLTLSGSEPKPKDAPRFRMCEGTREELERTGKAVDPFTGRTLTREGLEGN